MIRTPFSLVMGMSSALLFGACSGDGDPTLPDDGHRYSTTHVGPGSPSGNDAGVSDAAAGHAGSAGHAGQAGSGGIAGHAGQGGAAGVAGHAGSSGTAGASGGAGAAGHAGQGGQGGSAGQAGQSGKSGAAGQGGFTQLWFDNDSAVLPSLWRPRKTPHIPA